MLSRFKIFGIFVIFLSAYLSTLMCVRLEQSNNLVTLQEGNFVKNERCEVYFAQRVLCLHFKNEHVLVFSWENYEFLALFKLPTFLRRNLKNEIILLEMLQGFNQTLPIYDNMISFLHTVFCDVHIFLMFSQLTTLCVHFLSTDSNFIYML